MSDDNRRIRSPFASLRSLRDRISGLEHATGGLSHEVGQVRLEIAALEQRLDRMMEELRAGRDEDHEILRSIHADEATHRRLLREARNTEAYELAYTDPDPLVSVVIPTYDNYELLGERAIPSVLAQTHQNFELRVIGDQAPPEAEAVAMSFGDPRISYTNLPIRGHYPDDPEARWKVAGSTPANEANALATGRWIAPMADDDAMRPEHLEALLARARRDRLELVYGRWAWHWPGREVEIVGSFPPRHAQITLQAAIQHAELRFFELELADAMFGVPNDWARVERMLRAGVRVGMVDDVLADVYPSGPRDDPETAG